MTIRRWPDGHRDRHRSSTELGTSSVEDWNPATGKWITWASMAVPRLYHSIAMLMSDGRVFVAGTGNDTSAFVPDEYSAQIFSPPYLFQGPRPTITGSRPRRVPGGTVAGSAASPERQNPHARGAPRELAAPPSTGGRVRRPPARRAARLSRHTHGRSSPAPSATAAPGPLRPVFALTSVRAGKLLPDTSTASPDRTCRQPLARPLASPVKHALPADALPALGRCRWPRDLRRVMRTGS
jgi:hypothetical protein